MKPSRRNFIRLSAIFVAGILLSPSKSCGLESEAWIFLEKLGISTSI